MCVHFFGGIKSTLKSKGFFDTVRGHKLHKQAGTGPSRRHIYGSKIAKGLQNVKVLVKLEPFVNFFKSLTVPKNTEREDLLGFFNIHSVAKLQKIEGGPFGRKN